MSAQRLTHAKYLSDDEVLKLMHSLEAADRRDRLIIELALATGARAQELLNLTKASLLHAIKAVYIVGLKSSLDREIPVSDKLWNELLALANSSESEQLFNIKYRRLDQVWHKYRPADKHFHSLRHTFALRLYQRTKDLHLVKTALGHVNIQNTMIYLDYAYSQSELRQYLVG